MSATRHVDELFSAAVDGELSSSQQQHFDSHIETCAECSDAFEHFTASVTAVRDLPHASMPVSIKLPDGAPRVAGWRRWMPHGPVGMGTAVGALAAAVIAAFALGGHQGSTALPSTASGLSGGSAAGLAPISPCASAVAAASLPPDFSNRSVGSAAQRSGEQLIVATSQQSFAAGDTVPVYAALQVPGESVGAPGSSHRPAPSLTIPSCVQAGQAAPVLGPANAAAVPTGGAGRAVPGAVPPLTSVYTVTVDPASGGLAAFRIPAGTPPGTVITIVATVPAGAPRAGDPPLVATLTIVVR